MTYQQEVEETKSVIMSQSGNGGNGSHSLNLHLGDKRATNQAIRELLNDGLIVIKCGAVCHEFEYVPTVDGNRTFDGGYFVSLFKRTLSNMNYSVCLK